VADPWMILAVMSNSEELFVIEHGADFSKDMLTALQAVSHHYYNNGDLHIQAKVYMYV